MPTLPGVAKPVGPLRAIALLTLTLIFGGCASAPAMDENCTSLDCVMQQAQNDIARKCTNDLRRYEHQKAKLIDAEYRYPLTNYETYRNFVSMGGRGPSPFKWCSEYAARKVQPQYTALTASTSTK